MPIRATLKVDIDEARSVAVQVASRIDGISIGRFGDNVRFRATDPGALQSLDLQLQQAMKRPAKTIAANGKAYTA